MLHRLGVLLAPQISVLGRTPSERKTMDYNRKLEKLDKHLADNPKDYQAVIARMKTYSDAVDHEIYLRRVARLKKVAEYRRQYGSK